MTPTLLLSPDELAGGENGISVSGDEYRHLFRARRLAVGDELRLVDGRGGTWVGTVESVGRREATIRRGAPRPSWEPETRVEVLTALPRPERAAWLVEKATETGAAAIRFVRPARSVRGPTPALIERLGRVARAAVAQCGRAVLPSIDVVDLATLVPSAFDRCYVLDPRGAPGLPPGEGRSVALVVGPEGGFATAELDGLIAGGARLASLGSRILRVETAVVVGVSLLVAPTPGGSAGPRRFDNPEGQG